MPLHDKTAQEVLANLTSYCYSFGFLQKILADNGKEFHNKKMEQFCDENGITLEKQQVVEGRHEGNNS